MFPITPYPPTHSARTGDGLGLALAGARVVLGALPAHGQVVVVAAPAVAANLFQALDVEGVEAAQVALHRVVVHLLAQLGQLVLGQVLGGGGERWGCEGGVRWRGVGRVGRRGQQSKARGGSAGGTRARSSAQQVAASATWPPSFRQWPAHPAPAGAGAQGQQPPQHPAPTQHARGTLQARTLVRLFSTPVETRMALALVGPMPKMYCRLNSTYFWLGTSTPPIRAARTRSGARRGNATCACGGQHSRRGRKVAAGRGAACAAAAARRVHAHGSMRRLHARPRCGEQQPRRHSQWPPQRFRQRAAPARPWLRVLP